ncbi:MAG: hypothetical protein H0X02_12745 [Nitrosomonas sp.]|nr:hypothetical protein [Nitrosomonas sp.]
MNYLASQYGGDVAVRSHHDSTLVPETTVYAMNLGSMSSSPVPQKEIRGSIYISGKPVSIARSVYEVVASVMIRESGF